MAEHERGNVLAFPQAAGAIELRHLRAFVAVAEELHFSRAADRLHLSQSALSRQVSALERLLGCMLLQRSTRQVELTLAGQALLERAQQVLAEVDHAVAATQMLGGELAFRLAQHWGPVFASARPGIPLEQRRSAIERLHAQFPPPSGTVVEPVNAGGVPSFRITALPELPPTIFYLHGGGHVLGSTYGHRGVIGALAHAAEATALGPEFRLAPEHPFPADVDDADRAYCWLLETGVDPARIVIAGDSSGAGVALSLVQRLKLEDRPLPGGMLLFCPWIDMTGGTLKGGRDDEAAVAIRELVVPMIDAYVGDHPFDEPVLSPLTADLSALPPMLIQAGTGDPVRQDAHLLAARARAHGVDVTLQLYPVETHNFQLFWSFLPEAKEALEHAGAFVRTISATGQARQRSGEADRSGGPTVIVPGMNNST